MTPTSDSSRGIDSAAGGATGTAWSGWLTLALFLAAAGLVGGTAAGPGLSWDEPAYRHSQVSAESWAAELARGSGAPGGLLGKEAIREFWQFNRFGHNFHPPMASYANLLTRFLFGALVDDITARRLAGALMLAGAVAMAAHTAGRRWGPSAGWFAGLSLLFLPRVVGDAHVIGTDLPMLFFHAATALAFWKGLSDRRWQVAAAALFAAQFLVKFSAIAALPVLGLTWLVALAVSPRPANPRRVWMRQLMTLQTASILVALPLALAIVKDGPIPEGVRQLAWIHPLLLVAVAVIWVLANWQGDPDERPLASAVTLAALAPLFTVAMNPAWWQDTVVSLGDYLRLNLRREDALPDIGIFYLGQRYYYTLPWHSWLVLTAVTVPIGTLLAFVIGAGAAPLAVRRDPLPLYLLGHALALPAIRMLGTPAHDGVRLFLPSFFFLALLGGWGVSRLVELARSRRLGVARWVGPIALLLGPGWGAVELARIHPFELSYYNVGLARAMDLGFEPTYWYDAVTPGFLRDLNRDLPAEFAALPAANRGLGFPDPKINPETFGALAQLGRIDPRIPVANDAPRGIPAFWLLTHSSKATGFTRLLHAFESTHAVSKDGVRLFAVIDPRSSATAWALFLLAVERDGSAKLQPTIPDERAFACTPADLAALADTAAAVAAGGDWGTLPIAASESARGVLGRWRERADRGQVRWILEADPNAFRRAGQLLAERPDDVRRILAYPGYLRPERFGGWFTR
jgi:4-amino-4-deoxy-L-arabinose transferase-like glycosyltransferase